MPRVATVVQNRQFKGVPLPHSCRRQTVKNATCLSPTSATTSSPVMVPHCHFLFLSIRRCSKTALIPCAYRVCYLPAAVKRLIQPYLSLSNDDADLLIAVTSILPSYCKLAYEAGIQLF